MDEKLKDAIANVRAGDKRTAQRQLITLLEENPKEAQGWYLLSLLVDSPQKQAVYLSKTLALDPNHGKAQAQLAAIQQDGQLAPTTTIYESASETMDLLTQAETDTLPDWLQDEEEQVKAEPIENPLDTAVPNETLPAWLKDPALPSNQPDPMPVVEESAVVSQTPQTDEQADKVVTTLRKQKQETSNKATSKQKKAKPSTSKTGSGLNIILGILIILAAIVMIALVYLIIG